MFTIAAVFQTGAFYFYLWRNLRRSLHMMQQNSYYNDRYTQWLKRNPSRLPGYLLLATIITSVLLRGFLSLNLYLFLHGALFLALSFVRSKTKEKTPLVFTWRVKRLLVTAGILCFLYIWGMSLLFPETFWWEIPFLQALLNWLLQVVIVAANLINKPLEKRIADGFIRDANRILEEHPGLTVIGITGSYGKTSTKHILHHLLGARYEVLMTPESYNTTMGVVRTIREQLKATHKIFVVEMGAKKPGDIREICQMVRPVAGIITSIGEMHLDTFETMENIVQTKFELAEAVGSEGLMVLNDDNFYIRHQKVAAPALRYRTKTENAGEDEWQGMHADVWAENIQSGPDGSQFDMCFEGGGRLSLHTKLLGRHNVLNILAAATTAIAFGIKPRDLPQHVGSLEPVPHRLQLLPQSGSYRIIDDAYNANPEGAGEALEILGGFPGYRVMITPGMVELGAMEESANRKLGSQAAQHCDHLIIVGKNRAAALEEGARSGGLDESCIYVAKDIHDALAKANQLADQLAPENGPMTVLLENDLPDSFLESVAAQQTGRRDRE